MKYTILLFISFFLKISLSAQSPIKVFNDSVNNESDSRYMLLNNRAFINFNTTFHDQTNNIHLSYSNQLIIDDEGNIDLYKVVDSNEYSGFGVSLPIQIQSDSAIYQFGGLYSNNATDFKFLIRKTDTNLNLIDDTIYSLNNSWFNITDAIIDSNSILVCGTSFINYNNSKGFIFRINNSMEIIDSIYFTINVSPYFNLSFIPFQSNNLQIKITSQDFNEDWVWRVSKQPLEVIDTLYSTLNLVGRFYTPNSYVTFINDTTYLSPVSQFWWNYPQDTSFDIIAWIKYDKNSNPIDTISPFNDTIMSDFVGEYQTTVFFGLDSLIIGYNHNKSYFGLLADSSSVGILLSTVDGDVGKVVYLGHDGLNYCLENVLRFDNGNILVMATRKNMDSNAVNHSEDFIIWLLDKSGNLIQKTTIPIRVNLQVKLYPNPVSNQLNLQLISPNQSISSVYIFDIQGKEVINKQLNSNQLQLDVNSLSSGVYLIKGQTNTGLSFSRKFVKE
jgi:hypothetical protein